MYSLLARTSIWRELLVADPGVLRVGDVSLHIAPVLSSPDDVAAFVGWRDQLRRAGANVPDAWTLGAGGEGRLLLLYTADATPADVIEGFIVAWLAAQEAAAPLANRREAAADGLAAFSVGSLSDWRRDSAALRDEMEAAGWQCATCCVDDTSRRVEWGGFVE